MTQGASYNCSLALASQLHEILRDAGFDVEEVRRDRSGTDLDRFANRICVANQVARVTIVAGVGALPRCENDDSASFTIYIVGPWCLGVFGGIRSQVMLGAQIEQYLFRRFPDEIAAFDVPLSQWYPPLTKPGSCSRGFEAM